jgi:hypothetical protein
MLSVVIPTSESERALLPTLACLVPGAAAGLVREVILADAGSHDETAAVGDVAGCDFLVLPGPLGGRLSAAAAATRAPWVMFLRPGTALDPSWIGEVTHFINRAARQRPLAATFRPPAAPGGSLLGEAMMLLRVALAGRARPEQGLIIAKTFYEQLGGHRADTADPEAELLRRLGRRRIVMLRSARILDSVN